MGYKNKTLTEPRLEKKKTRRNAHAKYNDHGDGGGGQCSRLMPAGNTLVSCQHAPTGDGRGATFSPQKITYINSSEHDLRNIRDAPPCVARKKPNILLFPPHRLVP